MSRALHVETWGDPANPRVVCLHGVTGHGGGFRRLAEEWLGDYHVLAPDLLGHGSSPYEPPWSIAEHVRLLIEAVGVEPGAWIGHSFGGRLAFEVAARHPELVERLVLLDPAILIDPEIALLVAEKDRRDRSYASFDEGIERRFAESLLTRTSREHVVEDLEGFLVEDADGRWRYRYSQAAVVAAYGEMASAPPPFDGCPHPDVARARGGLLRDVRPPARRPPRRHSAALLQEVTVPGGHTVQWDALQETAAAISAFLRR